MKDKLLNHLFYVLSRRKRRKVILNSWRGLDVVRGDR